MSRQSTYPNSDQTASLLAQQRLKDKQREYTAFLTIHQQSTKLRAVFEQFNNKMEILGDGSSSEYRFDWILIFWTRLLMEVIWVAIATVVEHWQTVFRATHLALGSSPS